MKASTPTERLAVANARRRRRADLRRMVRTGHQDLAELLRLAPAEPSIGRMAIGRLLLWAPGFGPARARRLLAELRISELRGAGTLTARQRELLIERIEAEEIPANHRRVA